MQDFDPQQMKEKAAALRDSKIASAQRSIEDAKAEYRQSVDAIRQVAKLRNACVSSATCESPAGNRIGRGRMIEAVNKALLETRGGFTAAQVADLIRQKHPREHIQNASVASVIGRMLNDRVRVLERGSGRRPTTFALNPERSEDADEPNSEAA